MNKHRILFICLGNICRSPMAEFIFKNLLEKQNCADRFVVASAATSDENVVRGVGAPVYPPAERILLQHGIACDGKRAVQLTRADYDRYDLLLCMDDSNVRNAVRICGGDPQQKIRKLLSFTDTPNDNVADPWYTGDFTAAYNDILRGCKGLLCTLQKTQKGDCHGD